jgi:predicted RNA binding protein YcfA (HicA-like mRNA interferase family)
LSNDTRLVHLFRNVSVRSLEHALARDGFELNRHSQTGGRVYKHPDGRIAVIHPHHGRDTLTRKTLGGVISGAHWTEDDARHLGLL